MSAHRKLSALLPVATVAAVALTVMHPVRHDASSLSRHHDVAARTAAATGSAHAGKTAAVTAISFQNGEIHKFP